MKLEHLVATMGRDDYAFLDSMRMTADAVVINQCGREEACELTRDGARRRLLCSADTGVGNSRNLALDNALGDILLFSDDDLVYEPGYVERLLAAFAARPDADAIVFNLRSQRRRRQIRRAGRVRWYNYMRYGAARLAVRREAVQRVGLRFSTQFGGGTRYGSGEDTIFLHDCLRRGLRVYAIPDCLAATDDAASSWFTGYDEKFFHDKGALFAALYGRRGLAVGLVFALRHLDFGRARLSFGQRLACLRAGHKEYLQKRA